MVCRDTLRNVTRTSGKDGGNYYRIGFGSSCSAIALSASVKITTDGQPNRLCPKETEVSSRGDHCTAREVVRIDEHEYEVYARKRRSRA